ncbi:hypothetical protein M8037_32595 [Sinorhizobium meliloti]|uniref:hypothetical protein n=1 Tax=Rhizobium meliloti TaxID=382 RepID=UPI0020746A0D|nr:hypothetical protein [Sinorhizobium meliloti]MCM5693397.1 hypothetical protein [Sinorhizobium meliloti]
MVAMMLCPFADRIAPIAISMTVVGPGTIGAHPRAGMEWRAANSRFFDFAMQSRPSGRRRKKADGGRCGIEIEAAISPPVFGQTRSIEFVLGVISVNGIRATASWLPLAPSPPRRQRFLTLARNKFSPSYRACERFPLISAARLTGRTFVVLGVTAFGRVGRTCQHGRRSPFHQPEQSEVRR